MRLPWSRPEPTPDVHADWIAQHHWVQWEAPRNYVAGEASYRQALVALTGPTCEYGYCVPRAVRFVREPQNPYDPNAFRAEVSGQLVGYLRRHIAVQMAEPLDRARVRVFEVPGLLRGGSTRAPYVGCHVWFGRCLSPSGLILELDDDDPTWRVPWPVGERELERLG